jgi:hypothetical protein
MKSKLRSLNHSPVKYSTFLLAGQLNSYLFPVLISNILWKFGLRIIEKYECPLTDSLNCSFLSQVLSFKNISEIHILVGNLQF